eukprot:COSAG01_NODE_492_length_16335_cov_63.722284_18_plen_55_part_00
MLRVRATANRLARDWLSRAHPAAVGDLLLQEALGRLALLRVALLHVAELEQAEA